MNRARNLEGEDRGARVRNNRARRIWSSNPLPDWLVPLYLTEHATQKWNIGVTHPACHCTSPQAIWLSWRPVQCLSHFSAVACAARRGVFHPPAHPLSCKQDQSRQASQMGG